MTDKTPSEVIAEFLEAVLLPQKQQKNNLETVYLQFRNLKAEIEKSFLTNKKADIRAKGIHILRMLSVLEYTVYSQRL
jgi:hypothetical protein